MEDNVFEWTGTVLSEGHICLELSGEDGLVKILSTELNEASLFNEFIGKKIRLSVEVMADDVTEEEVMNMNIRLKTILDSSHWDEFCNWKGWNPWCINEGQADSNEMVLVPVSMAKKWNLI